MAPEVNSASARVGSPAEQQNDSRLPVEEGGAAAEGQPSGEREAASAESNELQPADNELAAAAARTRAAAPLAEPLSLQGDLRITPSGVRRALQLLTGLALLRWLGRGLLHLVGYGHPAQLSLGQDQLEVAGQRRLLGLDLGATHQVIPRGQLLRVSVVGRSGSWALIAALALLIVAAAAGSVLVLWGMAGRQVSWSLLGLLVVGGGVLLDAGAYLLVRRNRKRGLADLEILAVSLRLRLRRVPEQAAARLVELLGG